jgi:methyl-accepting chemotaxis protein
MMHEATTGGERDAAIDAAIDLLIQGRYLSVPDGTCPITSKLKSLARVLEERMLAQVRGIVDLSITSNEAVTETAEMMRAVREVDSRSQAIAAAAEQMVASVEEIARNASAASQDAGQAYDAVTRVRRAADEAIATMNTIAASVAAAAGKVENLANASVQIGNIVDQIEAIAKQTNLLALNATIEAARAGEAGKGFAVVAVEVKNLASQTAKATIDIRARIDTLRTEMTTIVDAMQESADAVDRGQEVIAQTGEGMTGVNELIQEASRKIDEISSILGQQTEASGEVSQGIAVIADMATHNVETIGRVIGVMDQADVTIAGLVAELVKLELTDATVHIAKSDHMIWRKKLAQMLVGRMKLNPDELANHTNCRLGKWYGAVTDSSIRSHPAFAALEAPHRDVHSHGIEAARKYQNGDFDGALAEVKLVAEASVGVMRGLDALAGRPRG